MCSHTPSLKDYLHSLSSFNFFSSFFSVGFTVYGLPDLNVTPHQVIICSCFFSTSTQNQSFSEQLMLSREGLPRLKIASPCSYSDCLFTVLQQGKCLEMKKPETRMTACLSLSYQQSSKHWTRNQQLNNNYNNNEKRF